MVYKKFVAKRLGKSKNDNSPFYLSGVPKQRIKNEDDQWFYTSLMGENYLAGLISMAAEEVGIEHKSNHSARKTAVKNLGKAGVPARKTIQMTGHKSLLSVASYDNELSDEEQENFSESSKYFYSVG